MISIPGYDKLTEEEKKRICNGVGPSGLLGEMIPEFGLTEFANEHDYEYEIAQTHLAKVVADCVLFKNCWDYADGNWLKQNTATQIFGIVLALGHRFTTYKLDIPSYGHEFSIRAKKWAYEHRNEILSYEIIESNLFKVLVSVRKKHHGV